MPKGRVQVCVAVSVGSTEVEESVMLVAESESTTTGSVSCVADEPLLQPARTPTAVAATVPAAAVWKNLRRVSLGNFMARRARP